MGKLENAPPALLNTVDYTELASAVFQRPTTKSTLFASAVNFPNASAFCFPKYLSFA